MFFSRKRFEEEVEKRVQEEVKRIEEWHWREEKEREQRREQRDLEIRLIAVEKACGIEHPSHRSMEAVRAGC